MVSPFSGAGEESLLITGWSFESRGNHANLIDSSMWDCKNQPIINKGLPHDSNDQPVISKDSSPAPLNGSNREVAYLFIYLRNSHNIWCMRCVDVVLWYIPSRTRHSFETVPPHRSDTGFNKIHIMPSCFFVHFWISEHIKSYNLDWYRCWITSHEYLTVLHRRTWQFYISSSSSSSSFIFHHYKPT